MKAIPAAILAVADELQASRDNDFELQWYENQLTVAPCPIADGTRLPLSLAPYAFDRLDPCRRHRLTDTASATIQVFHRSGSQSIPSAIERALTVEEADAGGLFELPTLQHHEY